MESETAPEKQEQKTELTLDEKEEANYQELFIKLKELPTHQKAPDYKVQKKALFNDFFQFFFKVLFEDDTEKKGEKILREKYLPILIQKIKELRDETELLTYLGRTFHDELKGKNKNEFLRHLKDPNKSKLQDKGIKNFAWALDGNTGESPSASANTEGTPGNTSATPTASAPSLRSPSGSAININNPNPRKLNQTSSQRSFDEPLPTQSCWHTYFCCCFAKPRQRKSTITILVDSLAKDTNKTQDELTNSIFLNKKAINTNSYLEKDLMSTVQWVKKTISAISKIQKKMGDVDEQIIINLLFVISSTYILLNDEESTVKKQHKKIKTETQAQEILQLIKRMKLPNLLFENKHERDVFIINRMEVKKEIVESLRNYVAEDGNILLQSIQSDLKGQTTLII